MTPFDQRSQLPRANSNQRPTVPTLAQPAPARRIDPRIGNEERKLEHRLQTAQHLRDNSARNGNPNLLNTADRMEQRAYQHYDSRLGRLSGNSLEPSLDDSVPTSLLPADDVTAPTTQSSPWPTSLSGDRGAVPVEATPLAEPLSLESAQALEERKLQHLFDVAQKLRDIAGRNGNENLLRTADKVEQVAISRYEAKLEAWSNQASEVVGSDVIPVTPTIAARP